MTTMHKILRPRRQQGMTLVEVLFAMGIGTTVLGVMAVLMVFAARSFAAMANYQAMDKASSLAADLMSREIREATGVVSYQNAGATRWVVFANTNATPAYTIRYDWSDAVRNLTATRSDQAQATVLLQGCDQWDFLFQQRTPLAGPVFGFSTNMASAVETKLVTMTWRCTRAIGGSGLLNTETVHTAQIVMRNQQTP
jgi:type II secretory pathway pseudopilin PulG